MSARKDNAAARPASGASADAAALSDDAGLAPVNAYDWRLLGALWTFVRPHAKLLVLSLLLIPFSVGFELAQPYLLKIAIVDHIAVQKLDGLGTLSLAFVGLVLLQALTGYAQLYALQLLGQRSMHDLRLAVYRHVLAQRTAFFDKTPVGRLLTRMTNDVEAINEMFASGVVTLIADVVKMVAIIVVMLTMDVELTLITFLTLPLLFVLVNYARNVMRRSFREIRKRLAAMNSFLQEHIWGIAVVHLFGRQDAAQREYDEINGAHRDAYIDTIRADAAMYALVEAIGIIAVAGVAWYAGASLGEGVLTLGLVVAFIEYINKFFIPVRDMSAKYAIMQAAMAATERITVLLATNEPDAPVIDSSANAAAPASAPHVEFDQVVFGYRNGEPVLSSASFAIRHGHTVAVVGATGSGKSTIIKLLTRLYEPNDGDIRIDGRPLASFEADEIRKRVTVVAQDVFLFSGTIGENLRLARADATDVELRAALAQVGADEILGRRGDPLLVEVAERGANFSAGERQLIAFARALLRDPDILVLDEATAHIDPEAEAWLERGMRAVAKNRTTVIIAHRLSTIRAADEILVLGQGRVIERGNHDALVAANGVYAALERSFRRKE